MLRRYLYSIFVGSALLFFSIGCDKRQLEIKSLIESSEIEKNTPGVSSYVNTGKVILGSDERTVGNLSLTSQVVQSPSATNTFGSLVLESKLVMQRGL